MKRVIGYELDSDGNFITPYKPIYEDLGERNLTSLDVESVTTYREDQAYLHEGNNYVFIKNRSKGRGPERQ